jgi:hypothetical protein
MARMVEPNGSLGGSPFGPFEEEDDMKTLVKVWTCIIVTVGIVASAGGAASASPPSNDSESGAISVDAVPFTQSVDTTDASADGPRFCTTQASVFYLFTPSADVRVQVDTLGSGYDTTLAIYTRDDVGQVRRIGCNDDRFGLASGLRFRAVAGTDYLFMVGSCCGNPPRGEPGQGGPLVLTVTEVSNVPIEATIEVEGGSVDPGTGIATITGTITCTTRSRVYAEGTLRQVRQGMFVARGYWYAYIPCTPGAPTPWSMEVDTETSVAFGAGPATIRRTLLDAYAGWRNEYYTTETVVASLQLA